MQVANCGDQTHRERTLTWPTACSALRSRSRARIPVSGAAAGAGAGIQADLKTFRAFGCFGTTAIVAVTAQNTLGVRAIHPIPAGIISAQIAALREDLPPDALKTGMLATREVVELVADEIG